MKKRNTYPISATILLLFHAILLHTMCQVTKNPEEYDYDFKHQSNDTIPQLPIPKGDLNYDIEGK